MTTTLPVSAHASGRYLVDAAGRPFPILGRAAWFITSLSASDYQSFLDDTAGRGFTAIEFHAINHDPRGAHPPFAGNGAAPFLRRLDGAPWTGSLAYASESREAPDLTTPNEAYWSHVDALLAYLESKGMLAFMFPAYVGWNESPQGWMHELRANGPARVQRYGAWLAARCAARKNIVWMMGGDQGTPPIAFDPTETSVESALLAGLRSAAAAPVHFSAEWQSESIATDQGAFGQAMTLNGAYSFAGDVARLGRRAYAHTPTRPAYLLEEPYDEEGSDGTRANLSATQPTRRFQWWGWLSTIGGYISGNGYVWLFRAPGWRDHIDAEGARDMARLNAFVRSIAWWEIAPSGLGGMRDLVVGGQPPGSSAYVAAAANPTGTLLVAYVPPAHWGAVNVDMSVMRGAVRARWFDPTSSVYAAIGAFENSGLRSFSIPGQNYAGQSDWVLVLDAEESEPRSAS